MQWLMNGEIRAESGRTTWGIRRDGDRLLFRSATAAHHGIELRETAGRIDWQGLTADHPSLIPRVPHRQVLRVTQNGASTLLEWLGAPGPQHLMAALSRRARSTLTAAAVSLGVSLTASHQSATSLVTLAPGSLWALVGGVLLLETALIRLMPKPTWFLLDGGWCVVVASWSAYRTFVENDPFHWPIAVAFIALARHDFRQYSFFASVTAPGE